MDNSITVCIPSIPSRSKYLYERAIPSVVSQTLPVSNIAVVVDHQRIGAWNTRNKAIQMATTDWIGFLDDDDALLPHHFEILMRTALENKADVVWGWFEVIGGTDPFPSYRGKQWNVNDSHIFPITCLVRRELIVESKAEFKEDMPKHGSWQLQDFPFWKALYDVGANFLAIDDITWKWYHHGANTSGLGNRH